MLQTIDFEGMQAQYKKDHFLKVETVHHEFLYSQFHPLDKDYVIHLERNYYPDTLKIFDVKDTQEQVKILKGGFEKQWKVFDNSKQSQTQTNNESVSDAKNKENDGMTFRVSEEDNSLFQTAFKGKEYHNGDFTSPEQIELLSDVKNDLRGKLLGKENSERIMQSQETQFPFEELAVYQLQGEKSVTIDQKFGISLWKINQGNQSLQEKEYCFKGQPYMKRFFISNDGTKLYYFICQKPQFQDEEPIITDVVVLNIDLTQNDVQTKEPLAVMAQYELPPKLQRKHISDSALKRIVINNIEEEVLYIRQGLNHYFLKGQAIVWEFSSSWQDDKLAENQDRSSYVSLEDDKASSVNDLSEDCYRTFQWYFNHVNQGDWNIKKVLFKPDDYLNIYLFASKYGNKKHELLKVQWQAPQKQFSKHVMFSCNNHQDLRSCTQMVYNKSLNKFAFLNQKKGSVLTLIVKNNKEAFFKSALTFKKCYFDKSFFLQDDIYAIYQEEEGGQYIKNIFNSRKIREKIQNFDLKDGALFDVAAINDQTSLEQDYVAIGQYDSHNNSSIQINYINKDKQVTVNYLQEISERKCLHPFIFFCKGSQEVMIQSVDHPDQILRLKLQKNDVFLSFVDMNHNLEIVPGRKSRLNETLAFLTKNNDKIHLNIIQANTDPKTKQEQYHLYQSKLHINKKQLLVDYGPIVKCVFLKAKVNKETNYLLVIQYRTYLTILSFMNSSQFFTETRSMVEVPLIFQPNPDFDYKDVIYYLVRDETTVKVQRLQYDPDITESNTTYHDFKSNKVYFFEEHNGYMYLMVDKKQIKRIELNADEDKGSEAETFDFIQKNKDIIKITSYDEISITDRTLYIYNQAVVFHETNDHSKNYDYTEAKQIFSGDNVSVIQGATKVPGMNNLMYVVKGINPEEFYDKSTITKKAQTIITRKTMAPTTPKLGGEKTLEIVPEDINDDDLACNFSLTTEVKATISQIKTNLNPKNWKIQDHTLSKNVYEGEDLQDEMHKTYLAIIPYLDSNELSFKFDTHEEPILQSSFINQQDEILLMTQNRITNEYDYKVFSKHGHYLYEPHIDLDQPLPIPAKKDSRGRRKSLFITEEVLQQKFTQITDVKSLKLLQISDNMQFLLFQCNNRLAVFKNVKEEGIITFVLFNEFDDLSPNNQNDFFLRQKAFLDNDGNLYQMKMYKPSERQTMKPKEKKYFQIFKNEMEVFSNYKDQSVILDSKKQWNYYREIRYVFTQQYFFLIVGREIEYLKWNLQNDYSTPLRLELDPSIQILRLITTEVDNLVQIVFKDSISKTLYIATWDLKQNIEYSLLELPDYGKDYNEYKIVKGVKQKLNYIVQSDNFYDLQFQLPFTFFKCKEELTIQKYYVNEKKISKNNSKYLGQVQKSKLYNSYSLLDLSYWEYMRSLESDEWDQKLIHLEFFTQRYRSNTTFHYFALESDILQMIYDEVMKKSQADSNSYYQQIFFNTVYPNAKLQTPFQKAVIKQSPKSVDIMLEMLISLQDYSLSPFIMKNFKELFKMSLTTFERYLDVCFFKHPSLKRAQTRKWTLEQDEEYIDFHTSYIGNEFYQRLLNEPKKVEVDQQQVLKAKMERKKTMSSLGLMKEEVDEDEDGISFHDNEKFEELKIEDLNKNNRQSYVMKNQEDDELPPANLNELDIFKPVRNNKQEEDDKDLKRVEFRILEFDWIFRGDNAIDFIRDLSVTDNDNLFALDSIKVLIQFLWKKYFIRIFLIIFLPFVSYMCFMLVYVTYVYPMYQDYPDDPFYWKLRIAFGIIVSVHIIFYAIYEVIQMFINKFDYFQSFWNIIDLTSVTLNLAFVISDFEKVSRLKCYPLGAGCCLLLWIKLFYFLRLFGPTASMIRMIVQIVKDMYTFACVLALAMFGFGNAFYIMSLNYFTPREIDGEVKEFQPFTGGDGNFFMALLYSFRTGLGDFNTDDYEGVSSDPWLWLMFISCACLIQIVLLNLLIAIMGDTYDKVTEISEQSKLKEICCMISENEFVLRRERVFKNSKYIIVANLEKADTLQSGTWEGKVAALKQNFSQMMGEQKKEFKSSMDTMRDEMVNNYKSINIKLEENQSSIHNIGRQIQSMMEEIKYQQVFKRQNT